MARTSPVTVPDRTMIHVLDLINGAPRRTREEHARSVLWLLGGGALALCLVASALHRLGLVPGLLLIGFGTCALIGLVCATVLEWRLGRDDDGDDDGGGDEAPEGPEPGGDPVDWGPFDELLRDAAGDREPALA